MKRDLDLVRKMLLYFEDKPGSELVKEPPIEGYDAATVQYHLRLMYDAGLLNCEAQCSSTTPTRVISVMPFDLTWEGHECLAKVRSEGTWQRIRNTVIERGSAWTFGVVNHLATKWALDALTDA